MTGVLHRSAAPARSSATGRGRRGRTLAVAAVLAAVTGAAGCAAPAEDDSATVDVVTSFYPLQFVAERVGGEDTRVTNLVPPGAGSHHLELAPSQLGRLIEADLVVYQAGFQPAVDEALAQNRPAQVVDAAREADLRDQDPHFWLDPQRFGAVVAQVATALREVDPDRATAYTERAATLVEELDALDDAYAAGLAGCSGATLVTSHTAFGYLADRYDLEQVGITGIDPDVEPSPARVRTVADLIRDRKVSTIFLESRASPRLVATLAGDAGVTTAVLDPVEQQSPSGADYLTIMRTNLEALRSGLAC